MITLLRSIRLWQLRTKWRLAFWQEFNKQATVLMKNPEEIEKKILSYIVDAIKASSETIKGEQEFGLK